MTKIEFPSDVRYLIENNQDPVLLTFVSEFCDHSRELLAKLESFHKAMKFAVAVVYFDIAKDPMLSLAYSVQATPTTVLLHRGYQIHRWVGVHRFHNYFDICQALMESTPAFEELEQLVANEEMDKA